ncbi:MAG: 50S ribosomal protein L20 [Minisyncoccia bacterium]
MARVKRGKLKTKKRKKLLKLAKGFKWGRKSKEKFAKEAVLHAFKHSYEGRKKKKRDMRRLWQVRINGYLREKGIKYSEFIKRLKDNKINLNRKVLAEIINYPEIFDKILEAIR